MGETTTPGDLQFEKAEFGAAGQGPADCARCRRPLVSAYYQIGGQPVCERCKLQEQFDQSSGSGAGRFLAAAVFGTVAALLGSGIWYAVRATTGYEVGLIAVVVGLMVGGAVRAGSKRRGGPLYQVLAVALTYFGICAQYVPDIVKAIRDQPAQAAATSAPATGGVASPVAAPDSPGGADQDVPEVSAGGVVLALGLLLALAMAAPFLGGFQNIIGILIIGFALWEAWKMNRRVPLEIEGPFRVGSPPAARTA
jgi:hypothetical protein